MRVVNDSYELVAPSALHPHPQNPNHGRTEEIAASILTNGFFGAVLAQKGTGVIIAGEHRWRAATDAGSPELPVIWLDVDDERAMRIMIADNQFARLAEWDESDLVEVLQGLSGGMDGLDGIGFTENDLKDLVAKLNPPTLEELEEEWGDPEEQETWPRISVRVPPYVYAQWTDLVGPKPTWEAVERLLSRLDESSSIA